MVTGLNLGPQELLAVHSSTPAPDSSTPIICIHVCYKRGWGALGVEILEKLEKEAVRFVLRGTEVDEAVPPTLPPIRRVERMSRKFLKKTT